MRDSSDNTRVCPTCGESMEGARSNALYCSKLCLYIAEGRAKSYRIRCRYCGGIIAQRVGGAGRSKEYCSETCRHRARSGVDVSGHACVVCGSPLTGHASVKYCSAACRAAVQNAPKQKAWRVCDECGRHYSTHQSRSRFCSKRCANANRRHRLGGMDHRERARKFNVEYQHVDAMIVLTRDDFTCYLCGRRADEHAYISRAWDNYVPNPLYPTLDHIIPLSRGGSHSYDNTACACWECNLAKGSMTPDEFYAVRLEAAS